jgi:hypothetical protein
MMSLSCESGLGGDTTMHQHWEIVQRRKTDLTYQKIAEEKEADSGGPFERNWMALVEPLVCGRRRLPAAPQPLHSYVVLGFVCVFGRFGACWI